MNTALDLANRYPKEERIFLASHIEPFQSHPNYGLLRYSFQWVSPKTKKTEIKEIKAQVHLRSGVLYEHHDNFIEHHSSVFFALVVGRPLITLCKSAYHLFLPLSFYKEIQYAWAKECKLAQKNPGEKRPGFIIVCATAMGRSLADIIRTPLYGIVLTIIAIAGVIFYLIPSKQHWLLNVRDISSFVEGHLMRGDKSRCLARCQQPLDTLETVHLRNKDFSQEPSQFKFHGEPGTMEYGLSQLGASQALFKQKLEQHSDKQACLHLFRRLGC